MKKFVLYLSLLGVCCGPVLASATPDVGTPVTPNSVTPPLPTPAPSVPTPKPETPQLPTTSTTQPEAVPAAPANNTVPNPVTPTAPATPAAIDCTYRIPAETAQVSHDLILKWAEKAALQSFNFDHKMINQEMDALKVCYTDQGWKGFNDALQKSGNLNAIKTQELMVNSVLMGTGQITDLKENQWKVSLPIKVTYQNAKDKITQSLIINLIVGRKVSGDLGIMQMIATPAQSSVGTPTPTTLP